MAQIIAPKSDVAERLARIVSEVRTYHRADSDNNTVTKIWNNGQGRLALFHVDEEFGVVFINCWLANARDKERIIGAFPEFRVHYVEYGYPAYYFHSFAYTARKLYAETKHF